MMSEHQKRQEARSKDYETIKVHYTHLKQVIINDETLEQTKVALRKFKAGKKLWAAGLRFNPNLQRWLNIAEGRIARWERDNPPEPEPESDPKDDEEPKGDKEPEKDTEESGEEVTELPPTEEVTSTQTVGETIIASVEPEAEEETPEEATQPVGEETDTLEKPEEESEPE